MLCLIHKRPVAPIWGLLTQSVMLSISFLVISDLSSIIIQDVKSLLSKI